MNLINKLGKSLLAALLLTGAATIVSCGSDDSDDGPKLGELKAIFSSDNFSVEAGGTVSLPFTVTGVEGATLALSATPSNTAATTSVTSDANYAGSVEFTAPAITDGEKITVTLTVTDSKNNRTTTAQTSVTVGASEKLAVALSADIKSMATKPGGSFELPFTVTGIGTATVASDVTLTATSGWNATCEWGSDKTSGKIKVTAPAALTPTLALSMTISDNHNRTAKLEATLTIVEISTAANAANCHIVAPGSTLTIKAVEGNSTTELNFNNAALVWQDAQGMVKSVSANSSEKVVVVQLNAGIVGNAVVAAKLDDVIVWSWHVWVTDYDPMSDPFVWTDKSTGTSYTFMDRNLGAKNAKKYDAGSLGLLYQWGRKDPFVGADGTESSVYVLKYDIDGNRVREVSEERPTYPSSDYESTNLLLSIQNPNTFYSAPSSAWPVVDWLTDDAQRQNHDLWGGVSGYKTKYDPCPEGWKVPEAGAPWGFRKEYKKAGALNDGQPYDSSYPWFIEYDDAYCIGFRYKQADSGKEYWFPFTGKKDCNKGDLNGVGGGANYNTATCQNTLAIMEMLAWGNPASETGLNRPYGSSVRCIKE
ncbi:hypothetical protein [Alistipes provencensis]|uniref:hypothetical protein n=1 Tax=Alistipes provencensis TaxID=1816676 RepID=UPI0007EC7756|nr:hypothetical protein [Alistipes provencensis]